MAMYELAFLWVLFMIFSVCGWVCESVVCSVSARRLINRGFLNGPYCPIYGCGALAAIALLGDVRNPILLFLLGGVLTCAIEYVTSWGMERLYHASWWDYSKRPLNINGRVWIGGFVEFGSGVLVVVYLAYPGFSYLLGQLGEGQLEALGAVLAVVFWGDFAVTQAHLTGFRRKMDYLRGEVRLHVSAVRGALPSRSLLEGAAGWQRLLGETLSAQLASMGRTAVGAASSAASAATSAASRATSAATSAASSLGELPARVSAAIAGIPEKFVGKLNAQERRIMSAFPGMRPTNYQKLIDELYDEGRDERDEARPR